jgi:hypothetical protein
LAKCQERVSKMRMLFNIVLTAANLQLLHLRMPLGLLLL